MNDTFYSILRKVFLFRCSFLLFVFAFGTIINIRYLLRLKSRMQTDRSGRRRQRIHDFEKWKRNCISECILGLIGIVVAFFIWALPPLQDSIDATIVKSEAIYHRDYVDRRTGIPNIGGDVWLTVNQDSFSVELYPGFSETDFPAGTYQAVVWYSPKSKILLDAILIYEIE